MHNLNDVLYGLNSVSIRVDFYCDSYQFAEPRFYTISCEEEFLDAKIVTKEYLNLCDSQKTGDGCFWATFSAENVGELFDERIKLK